MPPRPFLAGNKKWRTPRGKFSLSSRGCRIRGHCPPSRLSPLPVAPIIRANASGFLRIARVPSRLVSYFNLPSSVCRIFLHLQTIPLLVGMWSTSASALSLFRSHAILLARLVSYHFHHGDTTHRRSWSTSNRFTFITLLIEMWSINMCFCTILVVRSHSIARTHMASHSSNVVSLAHLAHPLPEPSTIS